MREERPGGSPGGEAAEAPTMRLFVAFALPEEVRTAMRRYRTGLPARPGATLQARLDPATLEETARRRMERLTPREHEVLELVVAGKMNKQIAAQLGTAEQTVKQHRGRVMRKLQVDSVAELVRLVERASGQVTAPTAPTRET